MGQFDMSGLKADGSEMILRDSLDYFKKENRLNINKLSYDVSILYSFFMQTAGQNEHASKKAIKASKKGICNGVRNLVLEICCTDEAGEDAEVPYIKYNFK